MAKKVVKLLTKDELLSKKRANIAMQQLMLIPDDQLKEQKKRIIFDELYDLVRPDETTGWGYSMISNEKAELILDAIFKLPSRKCPNQTLRVFNVIVSRLHYDTGRIMLTREQIAERIGAHGTDVSNVMKTLEDMGVVRREYKKVEGIRGRGVVIYFMNPDVAWHGSLDKRQQEAERIKEQYQLPFTVIQGGAA